MILCHILPEWRGWVNVTIASGHTKHGDVNLVFRFHQWKYEFARRLISKHCEIFVLSFRWNKFNYDSNFLTNTASLILVGFREEKTGNK